jgi:hypothetical protein
MRDDALPLRPLARAAAAFVLAVALAVGIVLALLALRHVPAGGVAIARPAPPGGDLPMLESAPQPDLAAYRAEKQRLLRAAGVVDASGAANTGAGR